MRIKLTVISILMSIKLIGQIGYPKEYFIWFDPISSNDEYLDYIFIDTITNPDNVWQIGIPQKSVFTGNDGINIVTDTLNTYPVNDTSSFILTHIAPYGPNSDYFTISGEFKIDTDSNNDFGKIEFSPDNGESWILISEDTIGGWPCQIDYQNSIGFTGTTIDYQNFKIDLCGAENHFDFNTNDTTLFKFSFISDSLNNGKDGWLFDYLYVEHYSLNDIDDKKELNLDIYPNPAFNKIFFKGFPKNSNTINVLIFSNSGEIIKQCSLNKDYFIDVSDLEKGLYIVKIMQDQEILETKQFLKN